MKKYLVILFSVILCSLALAGYSKDVNEKVLKSFKEAFPAAENVRWQAYAEKYIAQFRQNGIRTIVNYDLEGNFLGATRYYTEENLPVNVICKLKKKYPTKNIFGVTEVSTAESIQYYIKLEDESTWTTVQSDADGNSAVIEKYKKQK
jgi:hypothetical protein